VSRPFILFLRRRGNAQVIRKYLLKLNDYQREKRKDAEGRLMGSGGERGSRDLQERE